MAARRNNGRSGSIAIVIRIWLVTKALVIARQTKCPMAVGPIRTDDVKMLQQQSQCNVILADDGLQHYALARAIEIVVIDGERRFGNGRCLPAGPLREPISRLQQVDLTIVNGAAQAGEHAMKIIGDTAINLKTGEQKPLLWFVQNQCHAVAGIGNPRRFFKHLSQQGLHFNCHIYPDHHVYDRHDIVFSDDTPVLMTEKDAVKCTQFASKQHWYLPVRAQPDPAFAEQLLVLLKERSMDKKLLEILACPLCKSPLVYNKEAQELICKVDRLAYPIRDDIPVMLEDEARAITDKEYQALS